MIDETKERLRAGEPVRLTVETIHGAGTLTLVPFTSEPRGLLICVEREGSYFLSRDRIQHFNEWDLIGEGMSLSTANQVYEFLAEIVRPRRPRKTFRPSGNKWVQSNPKTSTKKIHG